MSKITRKPRKKMIKKVDLLVPVNIENLGSQDDPCFGKHYDIKAAECQRCGDCELCAIVKAQSNHAKRSKVEKEENFKDLENPKVADKKEVRKMIKNRVRELAKKSGSQGIEMELVIADLKGAFGKFGFTRERFLKIIARMVDKSAYLTQNKNSLLWKK